MQERGWCRGRCGRGVSIPRDGMWRAWPAFSSSRCFASRRRMPKLRFDQCEAELREEARCQAERGNERGAGERSRASPKVRCEAEHRNTASAEAPLRLVRSRASRRSPLPSRAWQREEAGIMPARVASRMLALRGKSRFGRPPTCSSRSPNCPPSRSWPSAAWRSCADGAAARGREPARREALTVTPFGTMLHLPDEWVRACFARSKEDC